MVERALYSELDFKELLVEEKKQKDEIIFRHGEEVRAFSDQKKIRMSQFKAINDRETEEEKVERFEIQDGKLKGKITERQYTEITKFNKAVETRIETMKTNEQLNMSRKMKEMLSSSIEIPEELDEMDNSNFVIND